MTISCFLQICIVDKSERACSTGDRIRMNKDLELGIRTYAVYFHSYQWSSGQPMASLVLAAHNRTMQSRVPGLGSGPITDVDFHHIFVQYATRRRLVYIKRSTLASFASWADKISETHFFLPAASFLSLFQSAQLPYGGADSSPAGWSRVVWRERSDPARQAQPAKVLGPKLSFCADAGTAVCCRTPCYTSQ